MPTWFAVSLLILFLLMMTRLVLILAAARQFHRDRPPTDPDPGKTSTTDRPALVSVIIPCFNEEAGIGHCLAGMATQTYPSLEFIVVDDGSTDDTAAQARHMATQPGLTGRLRVVSKENGGKADALNRGLEHARGDIVVTVDADSVLDRTAIARLVDDFADPSVGAVAGNVRVAHPRGALARHQRVEYVAGIMLQRAALTRIDSLQVISGALGGFRRCALEAAGGFSGDTVTEDYDITLAIWKAGYRVTFTPEAVAWTEAPDGLRDLLTQRVRWTLGNLQVLRKYRGDHDWNDPDLWRDTSHWPGRRRTVATVGLPFFGIGPWLDVTMSIAFLATVGFVILTGAWLSALPFFVGMTVLTGLVGCYALRLDGAPRHLAFYSITTPLWYSHLLALATIVAGIRWLRGDRGSWREIPRRGVNQLPDSVDVRRELHHAA